MRGSRQIPAIFCAVLTALTGCSRPAGPPLAAPAGQSPAAPGSAVAQSEQIPAPPAESALALKRGIAMLAQDRATFRPCNESIELWMVDQTDGLLAQAFAAEMQQGPAMLYIEAYGERAAAVPQISAARAYGGSFVLEEVLYAGVDSQVHGCAGPAPGYIVAAHGREPGWTVEVSETAVSWRQADAPQALAFGPAQTQDAEGAVRYVASNGAHQIELMIDAQTCRDPASGEFYAYAAKAVFDGHEFTGCARVGG